MISLFLYFHKYWIKPRVVQINIFLLPPPLGLGCHPVLILWAEGFHDPSDSGLHWPSRRIIFTSSAKASSTLYQLGELSVGSSPSLSPPGPRCPPRWWSGEPEHPFWSYRNYQILTESHQSPVFINSDCEEYGEECHWIYVKSQSRFCSDQSSESGSGANEWNRLQ